jgi:translation initiation factor 3 subunit B
MAPSFDNLPEEDDYDSDQDIDFSDLTAQHEVRLEQGLDTFVVVDGLPKVNEAQKPKLLKFLVKKLQAAGKTKEENVYMPINPEKDESEG